MNAFSRKKRDELLLWLLLFMSLLSVFGFIMYELSFRHEAEATQLQADGTLDLTGIDFSSEMIIMPKDLPFYPNQLLTHEDFTENEIVPAGFRSEVEDHEHISYGTYREIIKAQPDTMYMMYGFSSDYGMKLFCNGREVIEVGTVADNAEAAVARIDEFAAPLLSDENGILDIVIQYSNFVHNNGGSIPTWHFGSASLINQSRQQWMLATALSGGAFFAYALYFAYTALINRNSLYRFLTLLCIVFIFRNQNFFYGFILGNNYNWAVCYKLNLMATMGEPFYLYFVFIRLIPESRFKIWRYFVGWVNVGFAALLALCSTKLSATICNVGIVTGIVFVAIAYFTYAGALFRKKLTAYDGALVFSCVFIGLCGLSETFLYHQSDFFTRSGIMSFATILFIFIIKGLVDHQHREIEADYIKQKNIADALETQRKIRQDFLANISHEMRTPLTVISGYAQRVQLKIRKSPEISGYEEINSNLNTISSEARRLATLVNQLLETSVRKETAIENCRVDLLEMRSEIMNLCAPILEKNGNRLSFIFPEGLPAVRGNRQLINQILVNITVNANRHCKGDTLILRAEFAEHSDILLLALEDHGDGMSKDKLEKALVSGFSGDGGTGLGLAICSETMRLMEGSLGIESELGVGTTIKLFFKLWDEM